MNHRLTFDVMLQVTCRHMTKEYLNELSLCTDCEHCNWPGSVVQVSDSVSRRCDDGLVVRLLDTLN